MKCLKYCLLLLLLFSLTSCGFHLRAQTQLPPQLHVLYLESQNPYGVFETQLRQTLQSTGINVLKSPLPSAFTLNIISTHFNYTTVSVGPSSQSRVYTFVYNVNFSILNTKGVTVYGPQTVSASNNLILSADQLLQSNSQLKLLQQNMARDLVTRMYSILSSQSMHDAVQMSGKNNS